MNRVILTVIIFTISVVFPYDVFSEDRNLPAGIISGTVLDFDSKLPLAGANVVLSGSDMGAATDLDGEFTILNVPVGNYVIECSYLGYEPIVVTDIIVRPQRFTSLEIELKGIAIRKAEVTVKPRFFARTEKQPTGVAVISREEIRRAAGSAGDINRLIMSMPAVAKINDTRNSLVVRGGSPMENGYFIDNIPVPNINHFPMQGASNGALSLINVDFIRDVRFFTGGFSAAYGDRLSSIMDLTFREGNRKELDGQLTFDMMGLGCIFEGPLNEDASWMLSARRSYLDLIFSASDIEASTIPDYSDIQGKLVYNLSPRHKLEVIDILGIDESVIEKQLSIDNKENFYGDSKDFTNTAGFNWRYLWGGTGYSNTSVTNSFTTWKSKWYRTHSDYLLNENESTEQYTWLRNTNHYKPDDVNSVDFGIDAKLENTVYDYFYAAYSDPLGNPTPEIRVDDEISAVKAGAFISYSRLFFYRLTVTPGVRVDYFDYNENTNLSPRLAFSYRITEKTSINGAYGRFHQNLPMVLLSQRAAYKDLKDPRADHVVLGVTHMLAEDTRLTVEAYDKTYSNLPLDPAQPQLCIIDESANQDGFTAHDILTDDGIAYTRGIEVMVQKKLAEDFYGVISGSYFRSRYEDYNGEWRDRMYDNRYMFAVEGGYKPNERWEFSSRWVWAGGAPYTPFDLAASTAANRGVQDEDRVNGERLPDYHSLDLRFDRRFHFRASNLVFYLNLANAYGRENVASYYWNEVDNKQGTMLQWSTLPVIGLEWEF